MSITSCFNSQVEMPDFVDSVLQKCSDRCCFTCSCMRPRYKRLVDNIFPPIPQEGLVKNNMEKLTFYSLSSPEKLDRIGEYLYQKASRDISRKRIGFVVIAMEAMDQLLVACHAQTLNLFVESFLRMVQKLLESIEPDLQVLATQSFVRFSNIEEDTPSYHRRYDFFVSKFSSMCHSNHPEIKVRDTIRSAGIRGLQGVIRKTVSDDLVENIWEPIHMDKIVPSLLYNMQCSDNASNGCIEIDDLDDSGPGVLADSCLRELVGRASFGHVRSLLRPVLRHLDLHGLWVPNQFAIHTFRIIMFSIQTQYSYAVVESLMLHLTENTDSSAKMRTSVVHVLSKIISISAEESVGPSVLEIVNSLIGHVKISVKRKKDEEEVQYREALIQCLGEFTAHLPDYQKVEIMVFIISRVPDNPNEVLLKETLLKSLLTVGKKYTNITMNTTFPISLLEPLLRLCATGSIDTTLLVQEILHTLLDRHSNVKKLDHPNLDIVGLHLIREPCMRSDNAFMRKYGSDIYTSLVESLSHSVNNVKVIESIFTTLALLAVELVTLTTVASYLQMIIGIQETAVCSTNLSYSRRYNLHAIVPCLLILVSHILDLTPLKDYAFQIVTERKSTSSFYLLPPLQEHYGDELPQIQPSLLINKEAISQALEQAGVDPAAMATASLTHRHSWVDNTSGIRSSAPDLSSTDVDSSSSTPALNRKEPEEELSFGAMKKVLAESLEAMKEEDKKKQEQLFKVFRQTSFQDIVKNNTTRDEDSLQTKLNELLKRISVTGNSSPAPSQPIYEVLFPELFVY